MPRSGAGAVRRLPQSGARVRHGLAREREHAAVDGPAEPGPGDERQRARVGALRVGAPARVAAGAAGARRRARTRQPIERTDFRPERSRSLIEQYAAFADDAEGRAFLRELGAGLFASLESDPGFRRDNLSHGIALVLGLAIATEKGRELEARESEALLAAVHAFLLDAGVMERLSRAEITAAYDTCVVFAAMIATLNLDVRTNGSPGLRAGGPGHGAGGARGLRALRRQGRRGALAGRDNPAPCARWPCSSSRRSATSSTPCPWCGRSASSVPELAITWIIGRAEAGLVGDLPGVEFVVLDKREGLGAAARLRRALRGRRFDALLLLQRSLRAHLLALLVPADERLGFDRARAREGHGLFVHRRLPPMVGRAHVLDSLLEFLPLLGLERPAQPRWEIPVSEEDRAFAAAMLPGRSSRRLILSPGSAHPERVWPPERYAAIAAHAVRRHGMRVALCGGPGAPDRRLADAILARCEVPVLDLTGKDTLKRFLCLAERASLVLSPDSGPAHLANAVGTPVLGLYAATECARSGPYSSRALCVDRFAEAALRLLGRRPDELPWGKHIHLPGVMELITVEEVGGAARRVPRRQRSRPGVVAPQPEPLPAVPAAVAPRPARCTPTAFPPPTAASP
ncbi:MAG: glycosyltransferase family 9 protein [Xanthomonadales bacterium]|nr:glycosyltransferase family 9 protein [Xanthomonadales bacterium]